METFKLYHIQYTFEGQREHGYFLASSIMDALTRFDFQAKELGYSPTIHGISERESEHGGAMHVHLVKPKAELPAPVAAPSAVPVTDAAGNIIPIRPTENTPGMRRMSDEVAEIANDAFGLNLNIGK